MGVSEILGHVKEIAELIRKYDNLELYQKIVDLRDEIFELTENNLALKERVKELERQQEIAVTLIRDGNVYYSKLTEGVRQGPYCMACWDGDKKLINVITTTSNIGTTFKCGRCIKAGK